MEKGLECATTQTVRAQLRRAHLVSIDTRRRGIADKQNGDIVLSTHAAPCHFVSPCGRGVGHVRCARHRHVLRTRVCASQARAYCPLACCHLQRCIFVLCHQRHCRAAHWVRGCREHLSASTQIVYNAFLIAVTALPFTALLISASCTAAARFAKTKTLR